MKNRYHRHPLQVTSDRLADHLDKHFDKTDGQLRDAIAKVRDWLERTERQDAVLRRIKALEARLIRERRRDARRAAIHQQDTDRAGGRG